MNRSGIASYPLLPVSKGLELGNVDVVELTWKDCEYAFNRRYVDPAGFVFFEASGTLLPVGKLLALIRWSNEEACIHVSKWKVEN